MARRKIQHQEGIRAIRSCLEDPDSADLATAVRYLLEELAEAAAGNTVEVRVPPYGATQCIAGPRHTRGTPPNVVEMSPENWLNLAIGRISWREAVERNLVSSSGVRASLEEVLPLSVKGLD